MRHLAKGLSSVAAVLVISLFVAAPPRPLTGPLVINEVAWAGAEWKATAEWIELFNASAEPIDLDGWRLVSSDGSPDIDLRGTIGPYVAGDPTAGFFLLERGDNDSVPQIAADMIYRGALTDHGETLYLYSPLGRMVDSANHPVATISPWPAGTDIHGVPSYASMERIHYRLPDTPGNWATSSVEPAADSAHAITGTPARENSVFNIPPTPAFGLHPRFPLPGVPIQFDASESTDENDSIASYCWDFGDGTEGSGATVIHAYMLAGEYAVLLTVTDKKGGEAELSQTVRVGATADPVADFSLIAAPPHRVLRAGSSTHFQDESSDVDGEIVAWEWKLGDGKAADTKDVVHVYDRVGTYIVSLRVVDNQGGSALQSRSVAIASRLPVALLTRTPERPNTDDAVRFDASASYDPDGHIELYRWDFDGDGMYEEQSSEPILEHAFSASGDFDVALSVTDNHGDRSDAFVESVQINGRPIAEFQLSSFEIEELASIRFTDMSYDKDGEIVDWQWDFGDGTTAAEADPEHAFEDDGSFPVSLTVTDNSAACHTTTAEVRIINLPPIAELTSDEPTRPTGEPFRFDASASSDPSPHGTISQYEWDLDGDGTFDETTTSPTLSHAFDDDGEYEILVRVTDDDGAVALSESLTVDVTNRPPRIRRISWTPAAPTDDAEVCFTADVTDPDGEVTKWFWDLGDEAAATASSPTMMFPDDGSYTILLTVEDDDGTRSDPHTVVLIVDNAPPVAKFVVATVHGTCVLFDARSSHDPSPAGRIVHVAWEFGDGTSCPGIPDGCGQGDRYAPRHCYPGPGSYVVTLVVIDDQGALARTEKIILLPE
jgi:PKD repeat protein